MTKYELNVNIIYTCLKVLLMIWVREVDRQIVKRAGRSDNLLARWQTCTESSVEEKETRLEFLDNVLCRNCS